MKVALISHSFPPHMTGGIGNYTFSLAEGLSEKGIDVTVFCGGKAEEELKSGFKIKRMPMLNFPPRAVWFQLQNYKKLAEELKDFDIIHGQNTSSTFYKFLRREIKKPWIVTFHDCPRRGLKLFLDSPLSSMSVGDFMFNVVEYPLYNKLYSEDIKNANAVISVGSSLLEDLNKSFKFNTKKAKIIENGINIKKIDKITKTRKKINKKKDSKRIIYTGRVFYGKGLTFLVDSMKEVVKYDKEIILDIYGNGPLKKNLMKKISKNKLTDNVKLHEFIPNEQAIKEINKSEIVVLPSLHESFSIAVLEALACKKPVVATNIGGINEIIKDNKEGMLVEPKNSKELGKAIIKLFKNKRLAEKMGENGYKKVRGNFTQEIHTSKTVELYKEVIKSNLRK